MVDVPCPANRRGRLLVGTSRSLISAGTERMLLEFGKAGWLQKARQQPEKVRQVLEKVRTDGLLPTLEAVRSRLDQPIPLGYCNVGRVLAVGEGVQGFSVGDRVVSNGPHAEVVSVPSNLCALIPESVTDEEASFTVVGAIALQGIRLLEPSLGETVVVSGLGVVGLLAVQLLEANGCRVLGLDPDAKRRNLALGFGAQVAHPKDAYEAAMGFSGGRGVDGVLIAAAAKSSEPIHQAARICRKRGRIVLVGVTGLELNRGDFYEKELSFQVSCSYGPGRYDPHYEEKGWDYPLGFVRWTAQRNFEAVLDMMARGRLKVAPLISHRFPLDEAKRAYEVLSGDEPSLGILLTYKGDDVGVLEEKLAPSMELPQVGAKATGRAPKVSFLGAGEHASRGLIPAFREAGAELETIVSAGGVSAARLGGKFGFKRAGTDVENVLQDEGTDCVVIATRHDTHAELVLRALRAGKHVFVEKPLCLSRQELEFIEAAYADLSSRGKAPVLMVGFNRRFSPLAQKMRELLAPLPGPFAMVATVNAGAVPPEHWVHDLEAGGGRILGEACHFADLLRFLAGRPIFKVELFKMQTPTGDTASLQLGFSDGSIGTVHYFANGSRSFPKERVEVFAHGRVLQLENFKVLRGFGWKGFTTVRLWRQDKGHRGCAKAFLDCLRQGGLPPIPWEEILEVSRMLLRPARGDQESAPPNQP